MYCLNEYQPGTYFHIMSTVTSSLLQFQIQEELWYFSNHWNVVLHIDLVKVKMKVKLRFLAPSAGIPEIAKHQSSPRPLVMTFKGAGGI